MQVLTDEQNTVFKDPFLKFCLDFKTTNYFVRRKFATEMWLPLVLEFTEAKVLMRL